MTTAKRTANRIKTAFENALDREMEAIRKIERSVNAQYVGKTAVEISTGVTGVITELTWESSVWNRQTRSSGDWMVEVKVDDFYRLHLAPEHLAII